MRSHCHSPLFREAQVISLRFFSVYIRAPLTLTGITYMYVYTYIRAADLWRSLSRNKSTQQKQQDWKNKKGHPHTFSTQDPFFRLFEEAPKQHLGATRAARRPLETMSSRRRHHRCFHSHFFFLDSNTTHTFIILPLGAKRHHRAPDARSHFRIPTIRFR